MSDHTSDHTPTPTLDPEELSRLELQLHQLLKQPQPFYSWLTSKSPDEAVGTPGNACRCPIAQFINSQLGATTQRIIVKVYPDSVRLATSWDDDDLVKISTKPWSARFIYSLDRDYGRQPLVYRSTALDILQTYMSLEGNEHSCEPHEVE